MHISGLGSLRQAPRIIRLSSKLKPFSCPAFGDFWSCDNARTYKHQHGHTRIMYYLFVHLMRVKYTSTFIPVLWAVPISISLTPVPYISPPMEHLKNSIKFLVKVPVLSEKIYSTCVNNTRNPVRLKIWLCWADKQKLNTGEERKWKD